MILLCPYFLTEKSLAAVFRFQLLVGAGMSRFDESHLPIAHSRLGAEFQLPQVRF